MAHTEQRTIEKGDLRVIGDVLVAIDEDIYLNGSEYEVNDPKQPEKTEDDEENEEDEDPIMIGDSKFDGPGDEYRNEFQQDDTVAKPIPRTRQEIFVGINAIQYNRDGKWQDVDMNLSDVLDEVHMLRGKLAKTEREVEVYKKRLAAVGFGDNEEGATNGKG